MRTCLVAAAVGLLALPLPAQLSIVIPAGTATTAGDDGNAFPWGWTAAGYTGLRHQCIYDAVNFTGQNVTGPVLINRLKWRPNEGSGAASGGTYQQADVRLSTCPVDYTLQTGSFASNHGPDLTTVHSGPVTFLPTPGAAGWTPSTWCIDIPLQTPFLYDPAQGDLVIDCEYLATSWLGGGVSAMDVQSANANAGRTWGSTAYPNANGTWLNHGLVVEVGYVPAAGFAYSLPYGAGCVDQARASVYELFAGGTFDLSNTTLQFVPAGNGYVVLSSGAPTFFTPVTPPLPLGDDSVSGAQPLGFPLAYPGGSTNAVHVSSNGFVWAQSSTDHGCCDGNPAALLSAGARWCALWTDLDPGAGGTVRFDQAPGAAYVTFTNVPEIGTTGGNTFQIAFSAGGTVELRFGACSVLNHQVLTGWSPGAGSLDPGSTDLSSAVTVTLPDLRSIVHSAAARPRIGTAVRLETTRIDAGALLGATLFGLTKFDPGIAIPGMPGCSQYVSVDASAIFVPAGGVGSTLFPIPNNPAFAGAVVVTQGAVLVPGINALGALASNGLELHVDAN